MRPETPFDIDEIFHAADTPDMAVDIDAVVATGRRVRRRRPDRRHDRRRRRRHHGQWRPRPGQRRHLTGRSRVIDR